MNRYGKIADGQLIRANTESMIIGGCIYSPPSEEQILSLGYLPLIEREGTGGMYMTETNCVVEHDTRPALEERKAQLIARLLEVRKELLILKTDCEVYNAGNQGLVQIVEVSKQMCAKAKSDIEALSTIEAAMAFEIRESDISYLKSLYSPYLWDL